MNKTRIFVSYSHDSEDHKKWVAQLSRRLQDAGFDVILDQWSARLGGDLTLFMERGLGTADRVLCVCTEKYAVKANAGTGGVGYERMIVTSELARLIDTIRFVPIIRQSSQPPKLPAYLSGRFHVDMSDDSEFDGKLATLIEDLRKGPEMAPPAAVNGPDEFTLEAIRQHADRLARQNDRTEWRRLSRRLKARMVDSLRASRRRHEELGGDPPDHSVAMDAFEAVEPLICQTVVGIQREYLDIQELRAVVDELLHIERWNQGGRVVLIEAPKASVFALQAICGAAAVFEGDVGSAIDIAETPTKTEGQLSPTPLWQRKGLIGWIKSIDGSCTESWKFIECLFDRWSWLAAVFSSFEEYRAALAAYYLVLNVNELALFLTCDKWREAMRTRLDLDIPLSFVLNGGDSLSRSIRMIHRAQGGLEPIWKRHGLDAGQIEAAWTAWIEQCMATVNNLFPNRVIFEVGFEGLISTR